MSGWTDGATLLTGGTGLVGGELLPRLLAAAPDATVHCLVRARDRETLARRAAELVAGAGIPGAWVRRVRVHAGDLCAPGLGLDEATRALLARDVRAVVHAAATTRFDHELEDARRTNVLGTRHALDFARAAGARFHHVSTAYAVGDRRGGFHNSYEQSKAEAEELVRAASPDLHTTVYRPSIIVGDSRSGRSQHFRVLYDPFKWVIYGKTSLLPCRPEVRIDVVPVDFVCDALVELGGRAAPGGATHTLAAGPARALSIGQILERAEPIVNGWLARRGQPTVAVPRIVSPDDATPEQAQLFALGAAVMRTHVPYMLDELLFDDPAAESALAARGIRCPALGEYLEALLHYALERKFGLP
jgi:nucleoside-diphosphate-sugar epimerase